MIELFYVFFLIGLFTIGGGYAMISLIQSEVVSRGWITLQEFHDLLVISESTPHGAYKFKPGQKPRLRLDILEEVSRRLPGFPIVLHGASSVPQEFVKIINENGGAMPNAIGIPEDQLREAAKRAVCKINIDSDLRVALTAAIRKHFNDHPDHFDPRQYLTDARANIKELVAHKIKDVLGSENKA